MSCLRSDNLLRTHPPEPWSVSPCKASLAREADRTLMLMPTTTPQGRTPRMTIANGKHLQVGVIHSYSITVRLNRGEHETPCPPARGTPKMIVASSTPQVGFP